jgi:hypothetical protein
MHRSALLLLALLPACATVSSGGFEIPAHYAETAFPKLKNRATFDLDCPADQLTIVTLNVISSPAGNYPSEVGVRGCGRKAVYVPKDDAWRLSGGPTIAREEPAKAAPPAPDKPPAPGL